MIAQLRGAIVQTDQNSVIIDVGGVGYAVTVSGRTQGTLAAAGGTVTLLTDMQVREDSMTLYGFADSGERDAFRLLMLRSATTDSAKPFKWLVKTRCLCCKAVPALAKLPSANTLSSHFTQR